MINHPLTSERLVAIHAILDFPMAGPSRERFMDARGSELPCLTLAHFSSPYDTLSVERERCSIEAAAKLLESNLRSTPSVFEQTRKVGPQSQQDLCRFRQLLGSTPGECARETKLRQAQRLLTRSESLMLEVADAAGVISQAGFRAPIDPGSSCCRAATGGPWNQSQ